MRRSTEVSIMYTFAGGIHVIAYEMREYHSLFFFIRLRLVAV